MSPRSILRALKRGSPSEPDLYASAAQLLDGQRTEQIFDVGSNRGDTIAAFRSTFPSAAITGFEPTPGLARDLRRRFEDDPRVAIQELAISRESGVGRLFLYDQDPVNSLRELTDERYLDRDVRAQGTTPVTLTTLDEYCSHRGPERIDLIKMDLQGGELEALQGAQHLLEARRVRLWVLELLFVPLYAEQAYAWEVCALLDRYGYRLFNLFDARYAADGRLKWADGIFSPPPPPP